MVHLKGKPLLFVYFIKLSDVLPGIGRVEAEYLMREFTCHTNYVRLVCFVMSFKTFKLLNFIYINIYIL